MKPEHAYRDEDFEYVFEINIFSIDPDSDTEEETTRLLRHVRPNPSTVS